MRGRGITIALAALALLLAVASADGVRRPAAGWSTVVLVRHAEKLADDDDPSLSPAGRERARALARALADLPVVDLVATQFRRTRETLEPLAERLGLEVRAVPVEPGGAGAHASRLARELARRAREGTVVAAGHSNTVPLVLEALGLPSPGPMGEDEYDDLFLVRLGPEGERQLLHLHYGAPTP